MLLTRVLKDLLAKPAADVPEARRASAAAKAVLNVGGGSKDIAIPDHYGGWDHVLLDIDPSRGADLVLDARQLQTHPAAAFDAVYCSHNLEHYYKHDVAKVLSGFLHVLKTDGFAEIRVPDIGCVLRRFAAGAMDIDDTLYVSVSGPITVHDVVYGWGAEIEASGKDYYAHKCGFTARSLTTALERAGFGAVFTNAREDRFELQALAFRTAPTARQKAEFGLPDQGVSAC